MTAKSGGGKVEGREGGREKTAEGEERRRLKKRKKNEKGRTDMTK